MTNFFNVQFVLNKEFLFKTIQYNKNYEWIIVLYNESLKIQVDCLAYQWKLLSKNLNVLNTNDDILISNGKIVNTYLQYK